MRASSGATTSTGNAVLAAILAASAATLAAAQVEGPSLVDPSSEPCCEAAGAPEEFAHLEVRETEFILTNISDRPIVAWMVRTVTRTSDGRESFGASSMDRYRYPLFPEGHDELLHPGESVSIPGGRKALEAGWTREDLKGPGYARYAEVGALIFDGLEGVGRSDLVDRFFEARMEDALEALKALELLSSQSGYLDQLPPKYRTQYKRLHAGGFGPEETLRTIHSEASQDYWIALSSLRPAELDRFELEEESR